MKLKLAEKVVVTYLLLVGVWCSGCSRSTDSTMVRKSDFEETQHSQSSTTSQGGSKETDTVGPTTIFTDGGAWDQIRFGDDAVLAADGGVEAPDGGRPRVKSMTRHQPSQTLQVDGEKKRELEGWMSNATAGNEDTGIKGDSTEKGEKKTKWNFFTSPLAWIGAGVLAVGLLFALYRFRKAVPWLRWIP